MRLTIRTSILDEAGTILPLMQSHHWVFMTFFYFFSLTSALRESPDVIYVFPTLSDPQFAKTR